MSVEQDNPASSPTGARLLVDALVAHGVDLVFGIPGTHSIPLYQELDRARVDHVTPRHEQGAAYAADGYARVTGRPGVVLTTSGPGLLNTAAAAGQSYSDSVPLLLISPGMPVGHVPGAGLLHETKNQTAAMAAICGWSRRLTAVAQIPEAVHEAFTSFADERPRPVHLEIPYELLDEPGEPDEPGEQLPLTSARSASSVREADPSEVDAAAGALTKARRTVLIVGGGARRASAQVAVLAERLGASVVSTANGKGVLPEGHPLSLGAGLHLATVQEAVRTADALVAVGTELSAADTWDVPLSTSGVVVRVDIDPDQAHRNLPATHALVGDSVSVLEQLTSALAPLPAQGDGRRARRDVPDAGAGGLRAAVRAGAARGAAPWSALLTALREVLPADAVLANDSAQVCYYGALPTFSMDRPSAFLYPSGFGTLGYALPAALGAKVAFPDRPVAALCGDGGMQFTLNELATAVELGLPLPVVVVLNGGYGEIRAQMRQRGARPMGVDLVAPDFPALARAYGGQGVLARTAREAGAEVRRALSVPGPTVVAIAEQDC